MEGAINMAGLYILLLPHSLDQALWPSLSRSEQHITVWIRPRILYIHNINNLNTPVTVHNTTQSIHNSLVILPLPTTPRSSSRLELCHPRVRVQRAKITDPPITPRLYGSLFTTTSPDYGVETIFFVNAIMIGIRFWKRKMLQVTCTGWTDSLHLE